MDAERRLQPVVAQRVFLDRGCERFTPTDMAASCAWRFGAANGTASVGSYREAGWLLNSAGILATRICVSAGRRRSA
jgi:hypothetical protein